MKTEVEIVADELIADYRANTPELIEQLAAETRESAGAWEDGPEVAHAIAAELRRRAIRLRNS